MRREYLSYVVRLRDGRVLTGLIAEQTAGQITLVNAKNERTTVARAQIAGLDESPVPGLDAGPKYNNAGFWELPIPVIGDLHVDSDDVVIYDAQGYPPLKQFLQRHGVRHVLLTGYATDMCFRRTTAGFENLAKDFNVFLVGDATLATFPANVSPRHATNAAISLAALDHLITQVSWVHGPR
jgi:nicotinamidase-related amidase